MPARTALGRMPSQSLDCTCLEIAAPLRNVTVSNGHQLRLASPALAMNRHASADFISQQTMPLPLHAAPLGVCFVCILERSLLVLHSGKLVTIYLQPIT